MNLFVSDAWAQAADPTAQQDRGFVSILMLVVMFVAFYFLLIRPQAKRAKEHKAMISALAKGDEVVTTGGVLGRVTELNENYATLEIADGVQVKVQRHAVQTVLPKGTLKSA
ncbi:MAG: preprotein translocase subunit YajC [Gammaproteobacteria bacterium]|nr:preprotein translocase subunit YajC [Gammaproteobacteria bacterium]